MDSLYANVLNETQKIYMRRKTVSFLILSVLIPAVGAAFFFVLQDRLGIFAVTTANFPLWVLGLFTNFLLPLFIFAWAAESFAGELGENTLKLTLTRPISRFKVFLSKTVSLGIFIAIDLAVVLCVALAAGLFLHGGAHRPADFLQAVAVYIVAIIPMLSLSILAVFLAQFFKSSSSALTACILVYVAGRAIPFISPAVGRLVPFSYLNWHILWLGNSVGAGRLLYVFMILLSYGIIFFAAGFYLFDKKEL